MSGTPPSEPHTRTHTRRTFLGGLEKTLLKSYRHLSFYDSNPQSNYNKLNTSLRVRRPSRPRVFVDTLWKGVPIFGHTRVANGFFILRHPSHTPLPYYPSSPLFYLSRTSRVLDVGTVDGKILLPSMAERDPFLSPTRGLPTGGRRPTGGSLPPVPHLKEPSGTDLRPRHLRPE